MIIERMESVLDFAPPYHNSKPTPCIRLSLLLVKSFSFRHCYTYDTQIRNKYSGIALCSLASALKGSSFQAKQRFGSRSVRELELSCWILVNMS